MLSTSRGSERTDPLRAEDAAWRRRELRTATGAALFRATGYDPLRRWGQKTGVRCVWALGEEGRKVFRSLATPPRESEERGLAVGRGVAQRGRPPPVTISTEGALGLTPAIAAMGPEAVRLRGWGHQRPNRHQKVPAPLWPAGKA